MEPALSFAQCFLSCFKHSNSSLPHNCPPVTDEETEMQKGYLRLKKKNPKRKKQYERAGMKGSVIRVYESTRVRGHTLRMNVSRPNSLESPACQSWSCDRGWPSRSHSYAQASSAEFLIFPSLPQTRNETLKPFQISTLVLPKSTRERRKIAKQQANDFDLLLFSQTVIFILIW